MKTLKELYNIYGKDIKDAARQYQLDECILAGLIWQESRGNPNAISRCGAQGLTQIMPATAADRGYVLITPRQQIMAGADYLAWVRDNFAGGNMTRALAGYNAGPGRISKDRWMRFQETKHYVEQIPRYAEEYAKILKKMEPVEEIKKIEEITEKKTRKQRLKDCLLNFWKWSKFGWEKRAQ